MPTCALIGAMTSPQCRAGPGAAGSPACLCPCWRWKLEWPERGQRAEDGLPAGKRQAPLKGNAIERRTFNSLFVFHSSSWSFIHSFVVFIHRPKHWFIHWIDFIHSFSHSLTYTHYLCFVFSFHQPSPLLSLLSPSTTSPLLSLSLVVFV